MATFIIFFNLLIFIFIFFPITAGIHYYFATLVIVKERCQWYGHTLEPSSALGGTGWGGV